MSFDWNEYLADRRHALLSMDREKIIAYGQKYGEDFSKTPEDIFWAGIHKARTAAKDLPMEARSLSKRWLRQHGMSSLDDGDVPMWIGTENQQNANP